MTEPLFTPGELADDRALAESLMTLTFQAYEPQGWGNVNGVDQLLFNEKAQTPGKVQRPGNRGKDPMTHTVTIDNVERPVLDAGLHIPLSAELPKVGLERGQGWEYECIAVGDMDDPALLGRRYMVVNVPAKSYATARRLDVIEVTGQPIGGA